MKASKWQFLPIALIIIKMPLYAMKNQIHLTLKFWKAIKLI